MFSDILLKTRYTSDCNSAQNVMKLFKNWIEDYNYEKSCKIQEIEGLSCSAICLVLKSFAFRADM